MDILSHKFIYFLSLFLILWRVTPNLSLRLIVISIGSVCYYALNDFNNLWILLAVLVTSYWAALFSSNIRSSWPSYAVIVFQLSLLIFYKNHNSSHLPLGISFFIFQAVSYNLDSLKSFTPIRSFSLFSAYLSFFPQLVAGPICRAHELVPKLTQAQPHIDYQKAISFLIKGYFYKLVLANSLAYHLDPIAKNYLWQLSSWQAWAFMIGYGWQLYFDFWGYTNIAYGLAAFFGIDLPINFKAPYFSFSITDFWRRWHISLSTWFRDYVYIPLGGKKRFYLAVIVTFSLSGLWHGFGYNFLYWAVFHALLIMLEKFFSIPQTKTKSQVVNFLSISRTYFLITLGWVFFRFQELSEINYFIHRLIIFKTETLEITALNYILILSSFCLLWEIIDYKFSKITAHWTIMAIILFITLSSATNSSSFIYYRF